MNEPKPLYRTFHTSTRSIREVSYDGGNTWRKVSIMSSAEVGRREQEAYDMHRIQVELK